MEGNINMRWYHIAWIIALIAIGYFGYNFFFSGNSGASFAQANGANSGYAGRVTLKKMGNEYPFLRAKFGSLPGGDELSVSNISLRAEAEQWILFVTSNGQEWFSVLPKAKPRLLPNNGQAEFRVTWAKLPADIIRITPDEVIFGNGTVRNRSMP